MRYYIHRGGLSLTWLLKMGMVWPNERGLCCPACTRDVDMSPPACHGRVCSSHPSHTCTRIAVRGRRRQSGARYGSVRKRRFKSSMCASADG